MKVILAEASVDKESLQPELVIAMRIPIEFISGQQTAEQCWKEFEKALGTYYHTPNKKFVSITSHNGVE